MKPEKHRNINIVLAGIGVLFAVICFISADAIEWIKKTLVAVWILVPPVYFYIEWVFLYEESDEYPLGKFQYSQKLARDVWLAITAILIAIYFDAFSRL